MAASFSRHMIASVSVAAFALACCGNARAQVRTGDTHANIDRKALCASLDEVLPAGMRGTALLAIGGEIVWEAARGLREGERGKPITTEHLFDLGSLSKHVTAAAVLRLVDQRKLALDDPLAEHFDAAPSAATEVTVRDLLAHTSGLPKAGELSDAAQTDRRVFVAEVLATKGLRSGAPFEYSNLGYQLAAALVEQVAKRPFESFVQRELFQRAKLADATLVGGEAPRAGLATRRISGEHSSAIEQFPSGFGRKGATGALMSARDFERWDRALRAGRVLSAASLAAWRVAGPGDYSLGWFVATHPDYGTRLEHGGAVEGYRACAARWVDREIVIVVSTDEASDPNAILRAIEVRVLPGAAAVEAAATPSERGTEVQFHPAALERAVDGWTLASRGTWNWPVLEGDEAPARLHAFLRRERGDGPPPVSVYINVEAAAAARWLEQIDAALRELATDAPRRHTVRVRPADVPDDGAVWAGASAGLVPFVRIDADDAAHARLGLVRGSEPPALELEMDRATLARFAEALRASMGS